MMRLEFFFSCMDLIYFIYYRRLIVYIFFSEFHPRFINFRLLEINFLDLKRIFTNYLKRIPHCYKFKSIFNVIGMRVLIYYLLNTDTLFDW